MTPTPKLEPNDTHRKRRSFNRWKHHTRSCRWTPTVHCGPASGQGRCHSGHARTSSAVSGPADRICSFARACQLYQPHPQSSRSHNLSRKTSCRLDSDLSRGSSQDSREDSLQATVSAGQSGIGNKRARGHRWSCSPWGTRCSQPPAHLCDNPRRSRSSACAETALGNLPRPRLFKQSPPPTSKSSMTNTKKLPSFTFKKSGSGSRRGMAANS